MRDYARHPYRTRRRVDLEGVWFRAKLWFCIIVWIGCLAALLIGLHGCGGGSAPAVASSIGSGGSIATCTSDCTNPSTPARTCAMQGYQGTFPDCQCPQPYQTYTGASLATNTAGTCTGNPPPPACPTGESLTGYGAQCCPTGDTGDGTQCFAPAPATCPSNTFGTPPNCQPIPSCSGYVGAYWGGPGAGCVCPAGMTGTYPQCQPSTPPVTPPPSCDAVPGAYWGGQQCECPAGYVGQYPSCIAETALTLTVTANVDPSTVVDSSAGSWVVAPQTAVLSWAVTSTLPGDVITCTINGGSLQQPGGSITVGPFPPTQDGSAVPYAVSCTDGFTTASASASVAVIAPSQPPPPDTFTSFANPDGSFTFNWYSYGGSGCYVMLASESGAGPYAALTQLIPGGTAAGSATSAPLSPGYAPYDATLYCGGVPDPSVQPITVNP